MSTVLCVCKWAEVTGNTGPPNTYCGNLLQEEGHQKVPFLNTTTETQRTPKYIICVWDHIFCILQILEKKWEYNEAVHQLFIAFKKAYDSVRTEVLYNILIEFGIPTKLVRLIKMCLTETCSSPGRQTFVWHVSQ